MVGHASKDELSDYKKLHFETALFAGTFSYRNARGLIQRSPYMVLDVDDLDSMQQAVDLRQQLCSDHNVETDLCFVSPKGFGVKWVVTLPSWTDGLTFKQQYNSIAIGRAMKRLGFECKKIRGSIKYLVTKVNPDERNRNNKEEAKEFIPEIF